MKGLNAGKAVGLALLILALNLLITTLAITVYVWATQRGAPRAFIPPQVAGWSAPIGGAALFFVAAWVLGRRRRERNPVAFAVLAWGAYAILDIGSGAAMGDVGAMLSPQMMMSLGVALLGAVAGGLLARQNAGPLAHVVSSSEAPS